VSNNIFAASDTITLQNAASGTGAGTAMSVGGAGCVLLQVSGSLTGTIVPQIQENGLGYVQVPCVNANTLGVLLPATGITGTGLYWVPVAGADQLQANITAMSGGTVTVTGKAFPFPMPVGLPALMGASGLGQVNQGTAANLAGAWTMELTDGTNGPAAVKAASTGAALTDKAVVVAQSPNSPWSKPTAGSPIRVSSKTSIKGSAGTLSALSAINTTGSIRWVQLFDAATTGVVTLGSTLPDLEIALAAVAGTQVTITFPQGWPFANGLIYAATTTEGGATPGSAGDVLLFPVYA
jgi:hypothetical protein